MIPPFLFLPDNASHHMYLSSIGVFCVIGQSSSSSIVTSNTFSSSRGVHFVTCPRLNGFLLCVTVSPSSSTFSQFFILTGSMNPSTMNLTPYADIFTSESPLRSKPMSYSYVGVNIIFCGFSPKSPAMTADCAALALSPVTM